MEKLLKAVLVGCGSISHAWLNAAKAEANLEIVGLVDINIDAAHKLAEAFELVEVEIGTELQKILQSNKPDIVFDCTVPEAHVSVTLAALAHGCHVLGEKPLADSMENARKMVEAAAKAGKLYAVMQNRRYARQIKGLATFLRSGAIGNITTVNCDFYIGAHFGGFRDEMAHVLLLDMAIHTLDAARLISGADPVSVFCKEWNPRGSWYAHGASAIALFEMTRDIVFTYRGSWCAEGINTTWESDWRIIGDKGSVIWDGGDHFKAQTPVEDSGFIRKCDDLEIPVWTENEMPKTGHAGALREFLECVRTGRTPETVASDNIKSLAMVFGAIESADAGKRVEILG
ncbi:Gfo/Idh/MocA family oxidoreductase [candidate division KSB1 bacterium]|nr:Gfo/Idh/MocA family oxidoreductase [candidate division KSB1 bacterium]